MDAPPVDIIIPAFNQVAYCSLCVESIRMHTDLPYRLILVDNGSTDGVGEFFDSVAGARVVHAGRNLGFSGGVNLGLREAEGHALLLNSDTIVTPGWLTRMVGVLESAPDVGMVGPLSNYASGAQQIALPECRSQEELTALAEALAHENGGRVTDCFRLVGFCLLIRDRVVREVGLFDERYGTGNFEDDDYCLRVRRAGYRLCIAHEAFVYHFGNRTFAGMGLAGEGFSELLQENERRFREKWGSMAYDHTEQAFAAGKLNDQARAALDAGDVEEALRLQTQAVELYPGSARHHNDLGAILWRLGEPERAKLCFLRALKADPSFDDARANLDALGAGDE